MVASRWIRRWPWLDTVRSEVGASIVEYALLMSLIAAVAMGSASFLGQATATEFDCIGQQFGTSGVNQLVTEKAHDDHWHALTDEEESYARACLDGSVFKPDPRA